MRVRLRKITALQSPTGTDGVAVFQTGYICDFCRRKFDLGGNPIVKPIEKEESSNPIIS